MPPLIILSLVTISITECNLEKDIIIFVNTIQIQNDLAHIYDNTKKHLITIPSIRLNWLWNQYQYVKQTILTSKPLIQTFETEIV